ncbi:aminoglycoside phosphotransferase family protein [Ostreibacterium oceani]|uniref:Phosphotransferase n=1 Tax=Ostreibacterium oceani TaxID=2654998 RepID=A0A6N7ETH1_9GAMM|nr:phosphotransferase [Ostreibacterium oceani]MPV85851.1 phosphotransferase [Ostreibacterium oceani]
MSSIVRDPLSSFLNQHVPDYHGVEQIAGDASFRQYYRVSTPRCSYVLMDAPPALENTALFHQIAMAFAQAGIQVPEIIEADFEQGYLLLSDFGDQTLYGLLCEDADTWLTQALAVLFMIQKQGGQQILALPDYSDDLLWQELNLFPTWFVRELLGMRLSSLQESTLKQLNSMLVEQALKQPKTWVHRDFHSRNLMQTPTDSIGVIDFQDAVYGPITYDLVSILKDCYIRYPDALLEKQLMRYYIQLISDELYYGDYETFVRAFDWMGLQRHVKVLGIFSRLSIRDGKHQYLSDLPRVFDYVNDVIQRYPNFQFAQPLFETLYLRMHAVLKQR